MKFKINFFHFTSDGGGRSGVYLAVDANLELMEEEDGFDVFGYLKKLRQSRKGLVETMVKLAHTTHKQMHSFIYTHRSNTNSSTTRWRSLSCAAIRGSPCPSCPRGCGPSPTRTQ